MAKNSVSRIHHRNFYDNSVSHDGLHMCCFFKDSRALFKIEKEFILAGINNKNKIIYISSKEKQETTIKFLRSQKIDPLVWEKNEQLTFFSAADVYTQNGKFSLDAALKFWQKQTDIARKKQISVVQAIVDMDWILEAFSDLDDVIKYEAMITENLNLSPKLMFLCLYDMNLLPRGFLNKAIESHPFCKYEDDIYPNPYFISPKEYLGPEKEEKLFQQRSSEIKKRRKIEEELFGLYKKTEDLNNFSHMVAHDIKEPIRLANILNDIVLFEHQKDLPLVTQDLISRVSKSLKEAYDRVEGLKELNTHSKNVHKKLIDIDESILKNIKEQEQYLKEIGGEIIYSPNSCHFIMGNEVYISQLFSNIVGNSIKYRKKKLPLIINVKMESRYAGKIDIRITDNGQGFNPQYNTQIFRPFRRLHPSLGCEGNGIGLTICQRIMQELQGEILAEGEEGVGTTVILRFPLANKRSKAVA